VRECLAVTLRGRNEVVLAHDEQQGDRQQDETGAGDDHRQSQTEEAKSAGGNGPQHRGDEMELQLTSEDVGDAVLPDLIGDPSPLAPDVKVYPTPHTTWAASTAPKVCTEPCSKKARPTMTSPMMTDNRRL
jgi:hypothetical protein